MVTREAETGRRSTLLYKILLYVYAGRSLFCGTVQALAWKDWEKARKLLVRTVSVLVGIRHGYKQKPHRVKQFIVEPLELFCCYVVKYCFWALLRSLGERIIFFTECVMVPSDGRIAFMESKIKPLIKFFPKALKTRRFHVQKSSA
jgi:hypothetical protein